MEDRKKENGTVVRVVKSGNYTVMSNVHLKCKELSLKAKGLMSLCLSLPDDWEYSISGLAALSADGRESVKTVLKELKNYGFLVVTNEHDDKGLFKSVYTFFENPQGEVVSSVAGFPLRLNRYGLSVADNPQQLITNNKILKLNTKDNNNNNDENFKPIDLYNLYREICVHFSQPKELTDDRVKKSKLRIKKRPEREFWEKVFKNAEKSKFLRDSSTKWFCFDWVIKNDNNPLKVYEGNYGGGYEKDVNFSNATPCDKYANVYGKGEL